MDEADSDGRDLRGRQVLNRLHVVAIEIQLQNAGALDWFAIDLAFRLGTPLEEDPGGLDGIGVADAKRRFAGMIAGESQHDVTDAAAELLDRFIARHRPTPDFVQEPFRAAKGNLPVRNALQVAADVRLTQRRLWDERHRIGKLRVDDFSGFSGAIQRTVHDAPEAAAAKGSAGGRRLGAAECAEVEAGQMAIENPMRILDIGMTHQEHARAWLRKAQSNESTIGRA